MPIVSEKKIASIFRAVELAKQIDCQMRAAGWFHHDNYCNGSMVHIALQVYEGDAYCKGVICKFKSAFE
jgi:hypothetical protein